MYVWVVTNWKGAKEVGGQVRAVMVTRYAHAHVFAPLIDLIPRIPLKSQNKSPMPHKHTYLYSFGN